MKMISLSHTDLDGVGCQIAIHKYFNLSNEDIRYIRCSYNKFIESLENIISLLGRYETVSNVFITDLNFDDQSAMTLYKLISLYPGVMFHVIDHHEYTESATEIINKIKSKFSNFKFVHSLKACGTKLTYLYIENKFNFKYENDSVLFFERINAYDLFLTDDKNFKAGTVYNDILFSTSMDSFFLSYKNEHILRESDKNLYKELMIKKANLWNELKEEGMLLPFNDEIFLTFTDKFINYITLDFPNYNFYINSGKSSINVRISKNINKENALKIKEAICENVERSSKVLSAGGHAHAFGITLLSEDKKIKIDLVKYIIETIQENTEI